jgi:hypothetical protein
MHGSSNVEDFRIDSDGASCHAGAVSDAPTLDAIAAQPRPTRFRVLERFLVGGGGALPPASAFQEATVAGHAYVSVPEHPQRAELREWFLYLTTRHLSVKREVARLLRAFEAAGVDALVLKGFHLAEFVYDAPGQRQYADVDLLVADASVQAACAAATRLGWEVTWSAGAADHPLAPRSPGYRGHEVAQISLPALDLLLDMHRRVAHNNHNRLAAAGAQARITEAVWRGAETVAWEGTRVRLPHPADAVVVGLAINRCWGSDAWWVKARDYTDIEALVARHGLTREDVVERARALGVSRTVELYLERCDPFRGKLSLAAPTWWQVRWWNLLVTRERGPRDLQHLVMESFDLLTGVLDVALVLPTVWRAERLVRADVRPEQAPRGSSTAAASLPSSVWRRTRRAIHRSLRLLRVDAASWDAVATRAAFETLRRRGLAVVLDAAPGADGREEPRLLLDDTHLVVPSRSDRLDPAA